MRLTHYATEKAFKEVDRQEWKRKRKEYKDKQRGERQALELFERQKEREANH